MAVRERAGRSQFAVGLALATFAPLLLAPLVAPAVGSTPSQVLGTLVVVGYAGHIAVTGWLWTVPDVRTMVCTRRARLIAVPAMVVIVSALVSVATTGRVLRVLLVVFFAWQFFHFQRQNLGLVRLLCKKWTAEPLTSIESNLVTAAGLCGIVVVVVRPQLLGLPGVPSGSISAVAVPLAQVGMATCAVLSVVAATSSGRPLPVVVAHIAAAIFMGPVFLFHTPGAAVTGMVIAHGLQYLWVVGWRSHASRCGESGGGWRIALGIVAVAAIGGAILEAASELHGRNAVPFRLVYGAYLGVVMAHFVIDAQIWRSPAPSMPCSVPLPPLVPSAAQGRL